MMLESLPAPPKGSRLKTRASGEVTFHSHLAVFVLILETPTPLQFFCPNIPSSGGAFIPSL